MRLPMAAHRTAYGDDADALVRLVFGLTIAVGTVATAMIAATGDVPLLGLPTLVLLAWLVAGASVAGAAWAAAAVWLVLAPIARGEALLAPLAMFVLCLAIALGPERLLSWLAHDLAPGRAAADEGWIEADERRIG
jgi:hypothetical protein